MTNWLIACEIGGCVCIYFDLMYSIIVLNSDESFEAPVNVKMLFSTKLVSRGFG